MYNSEIDVIIPQPQSDFVETFYIKSLTQRALDYINAGFPVHFKGPTGVGKTTLALHTAAKLRRPVVFISGNEELNTSQLVGGVYGYSKKYLRDNFIARVLKVEETATHQWADDRLTVACEQGFTLIYDEFNRSRPEANNVLLSVLQEKLLPMSGVRGRGSYIQVHPNFTAIFTSNPEEYAGVYQTQDALRDRLVTIELETLDQDTEIAITQAKSGLDLPACRKIVSLVRTIREAKASKATPTIRACIVIARVLRLKNAFKRNDHAVIKQTFLDIVLPEIPREEREKVRQMISDEARIAGL